MAFLFAAKVRFVSLIKNVFLVFFYGTGSYPCPPQGWQRAMRLTASHEPRNAPYFFTASTAYSEQVGVYRQLAGVKGEMQ
jgi:hypothetical protein